MPDPDFAEQLLTAAERDLTVWRKLVNDAEVHDAVLGFHAQQAVEKLLKAVLARAGVVFRRTHDLAELLDVLHDAGLPDPPHAERLDELNPFAVEARYGMGGEGLLMRAEVGRWLDTLCMGTGSGPWRRLLMPMSRTFFLSRHPGAVEWARRRGPG